ncbi:hypothetical protein K504DRAFT_101116 [Pleomassaria siparia CBS 279.74]|uniref:Uncharacterized protein n=1 Tax=Pleomassaria siparia CBS 279.74 TaxID=1314801 RepID=A0A6G1JYU5_9PLEO|nr:hypothetical protein K504DRAFT_101116 [Pleomassaria siparia CBS 279.74]
MAARGQMGGGMSGGGVRWRSCAGFGRLHGTAAAAAAVTAATAATAAWRVVGQLRRRWRRDRILCRCVPGRRVRAGEIEREPLQNARSCAGPGPCRAALDDISIPP